MNKTLFLLLYCYLSGALANETYIEWQNQNNAIDKPLTTLPGNASRGLNLITANSKGNCLACHTLPIKEEPFHGDLGPDLTHVASRLNEGQLRLRVVDIKQINPHSIMPGYYRNPELFNLVAKEYAGKTLLTAQEVEDIIAYLMTLK